MEAPPATAAAEATKPDPAAWTRYYSRKRIVHQWLQVAMLEGLPVRRLLEIGPYMGLVTAMLSNAGYDVTTLDMEPQAFTSPKVDHIQSRLDMVRPDQIQGFDAMLCCETLEHIRWEDVADTLQLLHKGAAPYLLVSVPYMGFQVEFSLYFNRYVRERYFTMKKLNFLKFFKPHPEPFGHQWEVGYRGHSLKAWEATLRGAGYRIRARRFSYPCRSVFHLLEHLPAPR